jgi:transcriptional regulator
MFFFLTKSHHLFTLGIERTVMNEAPSRDLFPGSLEMMILQTLRREPMHGYALAETIRQGSNDLLQVEEGSLYPALLRMLKAGWVSSEWGVSARNRRVRIYRITAAGRKQLTREVSAFERMLEGFQRVMRMAH